jgi:AcrR family transcriptional regulator
MKTKLPAQRLPQRSDGEQSRERLVRAALRLFARQGYSKTSTREIAEAAEANVAAISYYFGDKAGLYHAAFFEPRGRPEDDIARFNDPALTLHEALHGLYATFLEPLQDGDMARDCIQLHFREMLEPTGLWADEISRGIKPQHDAFVTVLCRHLGLRRADDEIHRLALSIAALGVHLYVCGDVTDVLAPRLNSRPRALSLWAYRLVMYAEAMVDAEARRRGIEVSIAPVPPAGSTPKKKK